MRVFSTSDKKKILIASHFDKETPILESRLKARGYEVEIAETSIDVVHKVNRSHFDIILLDAKMEEVRHTELAELLRKRSFLRSIPIVMIADPDDIVSLISSVSRGFDDFFVRPIDPLTLQLRVALNIRRAEERLETNPLTQLPGNVAIEKTIKHLIETRALFSVVYADLDNFKALNDSFGYEIGDDVLRQTAYILENHAKHIEGRIASFVGHVGGDDFVLVVCPTVAEKMAKAVIKDFDKVVLTYYPEEAKEKGFVEVKSRKGEVEQFPLISISLAEVSNEYLPIQSPGEAAHRLIEVKKFLKSQKGSNHLKDRRGRPFSSLDEAETALAPPEKENSEPLGQILVKAGLIKDETLRQALEQHFETGEMLGQVLISMQAISSQELGGILSRKFGVPYAALKDFQPAEDVLQLLLPDFVRGRQVIPLDFAGESTLYLGMVNPADQAVIQEVEEITRLSVKPFLVLDNEFNEFISRFYMATPESGSAVFSPEI